MHISNTDYQRWLADKEKPDATIGCPTPPLNILAHEAEVSHEPLQLLLNSIPDDDCLQWHVEYVVENCVGENSVPDHKRLGLTHAPGESIESSFNTFLETISGFVLFARSPLVFNGCMVTQIASHMASAPAVQLFTVDSDTLEQGCRVRPRFIKPWDPDLLLAHDYIQGAALLDVDLVRQLGGLRPEYGRAAVYDLLLRASTMLCQKQTRHIPVMLFHRLADTPVDHGAENSAVSAFVRKGSENTEVAETSPGYRHIVWLPAEWPRISLIIPTRDQAALLGACLRSLLGRTDYPDFEILLVNNRSVEPATFRLFEMYSRHSNVRIIEHDAPFSFPHINNVAARQASGEILGLINNDVEVMEPGWLKEMAGHALRPEVGAVGAMLLYPDTRIQHAGVVLGMCGTARHADLFEPHDSPGYLGRLRCAQRMSAVTGGCMLTRRELYEKAGGLEEELPVSYNDIDYCLRLREMGKLVIWTPHARLIHHESVSRGDDGSPEKRAQTMKSIAFFKSRWAKWIESDPEYNPNLALEPPGFRLPDAR
ncbi:glycosyltransferase family 2 protein [Oceanidesulfovibrio marinus]|uniref:Glycosyltransferase 2-like domain-containing protein n=1 Tax=Oceanidesulfovibrio marinus TaxID=370038 RepID=A0A6P1ZL84_9BACT|nr:glycosyltransferase family 2 protein [Oceanidesulfovibrio marinus]TVM36070.1 hypothetical protein DQK91_05350 [Oceanidesulfovibrio marinus]